MKGLIQPRTGLEEFVMREEITLAQREDQSSLSNRLTRKVTVRIGLHHYVALRLLAGRYGDSISGMGERLLEVAVSDAASFAGFEQERIEELVNEEFRKVKESDLPLRQALEANDIERVPIEETN